MIQPERTSDIFSLNKSDNSQYIHICIYVASEKWFNCLIQKLHLIHMMISHTSQVSFKLLHYKTQIVTEWISKGPFEDLDTHYCDQFTMSYPFSTDPIMSNETEEMFLSYDAPRGWRRLNPLLTPNPNLARPIPGEWTLLNGGSTTYKMLQRCLANLVIQ